MSTGSCAGRRPPRDEGRSGRSIPTPLSLILPRREVCEANPDQVSRPAVTQMDTLRPDAHRIDAVDDVDPAAPDHSLPEGDRHRHPQADYPPRPWSLRWPGEQDPTWTSLWTCTASAHVRPPRQPTRSITRSAAQTTTVIQSQPRIPIRLSRCRSCGRRRLFFAIRSTNGKTVSGVTRGATDPVLGLDECSRMTPGTRGTPTAERRPPYTRRSGSQRAANRDSSFVRVPSTGGTDRLACATATRRLERR